MSALKFTVSAPGKVIISGEHSVVYGKAALAGAIDMRNSLQLEATSATHIRLEFDLFAQPLEVSIAEFNQLLGSLFQLAGGAQRSSLPANIEHEEFLRPIEAFVAERWPADGDKEFGLTCSAALYLLAGNLCATGCSEMRYGLVGRFKSGLPKGAGLGSSAAFGVCLGAAFYFYANYRLNPACIAHFNDPLRPASERDAILRTISGWAFCSERLMHGNPSGLDNTICTYGSLVKFYKNRAPIVLPARLPCEMLLINSAVARSTRHQVELVAELRAAHPQLVDALLASMDALTSDIERALDCDDIGEARNRYPGLRRLIDMNDDLLRAIGVSHPTLERIVRMCRQHLCAAKLTGAGGGGYAFALLAPAPRAAEAEAHLAELGEELRDAGFEWHRTTVGGGGVLVEDQTA